MNPASLGVWAHDPCYAFRQESAVRSDEGVRSRIIITTSTTMEAMWEHDEKLRGMRPRESAMRFRLTSCLLLL